MTSISYPDFQVFCNSFIQQCIMQDFSLLKLGWKPCTFSIQALKDSTTPNIDLSDLLQRKYEGGVTLSKLQTRVMSPISVGLYTETKPEYTLRKYETGNANKQINTDYEELAFCEKVVKEPAYDCILLARSESFSGLSSYYAHKLDKKKLPVFSNLIVSPTKTGYEFYLETLLRFYPHCWLACYIDWKLHKAYSADLQQISTYLATKLTSLFTRVQKVWNGRTYTFYYALDRKAYSDILWNVFIPCPGIVIGTVPALVIYGQVLKNVMYMHTGEQ